MPSEKEVKDAVNEKVKEASDKAKEEASEITETVKNDPANAPRRIKYTIRQNWHWILLGLALSVVIIFGVFGGISIPQWFWHVFFGTIIVTAAMYPYAKWFSEYIVEDNRKPVLDIGDNSDEGFGFYWVPENRKGDVEFIEDSPIERPTSEGMGWEVRDFNVYEEGGYQYIEAKGTWKGSMGALDLDRKEANIQNLRDDLEPMAKVGHKYEIKLPQIVHRIERIVTNEFMYQMQGVTNYRGKEIHSEVQDITRAEIEEVKDVEDNEQTDSSELEETMNELNEILDNSEVSDD